MRLRRDILRGNARLRRHEGTAHTTGAVEQPIASLDGIVYSVRARSVVNLPQTEADLGHLVAIVQRDVGCVDSHCCEKVTVRVGRSEGRRFCSRYASANRREERASGNYDRCEGTHSINTRTAKATGNHVRTVFYQVTTKFPGVSRLYTPPKRLDGYDPASSTGRLGCPLVSYLDWNCIRCYLTM